MVIQVEIKLIVGLQLQDCKLIKFNYLYIEAWIYMSRLKCK